MTTEKERQEWRDFAHTVDVLTAAAFAEADVVEAPARAPMLAAQASAARPAPRFPRRVAAGVLAAACLLLVAVPVARLLDPAATGSRDAGQGRVAVPQSAIPAPGAPTREMAAAGIPADGLRLTLSKPSFSPGEPVSFRLQRPQTCRATLYSIASNGEVRVFEPATAGSDLLQVPNPSTPGRYTLGALCGADAPSSGSGIGTLREKARGGGASFEAYLAGLSGPDLPGTAEAAFEVR